MNKYANVPRLARENLDSGMCCSEAIFAAFLDAMGENKDMMRIATPFGAGIGRVRNLCGILTGGIMVIGLQFGRTNKIDLQAKTDCYGAAAEFYRWFESKYQCRCDEILTGEFSGHTEQCLEIVEEAARKIIKLIS